MTASVGVHSTMTTMIHAMSVSTTEKLITLPDHNKESENEMIEDTAIGNVGNRDNHRNIKSVEAPTNQEDAFNVNGTSELVLSLFGPKKEAEIICSYWIRTVLNDPMITIKHLTSMVLQHLPHWRILEFSTKFKSGNGLTLSDNNQLVTRGPYLDDDDIEYRWILADIVPVTMGIRCWRISTKHQNTSGWVFYGVSPQRMFDHTFGQHGVWGVACTGCYPSNAKHNDFDHKMFYRSRLEVDVLLNLIEGTLRVCIVGTGVLSEPGAEAILYGIDAVENKEGWVPHVNIYNEGMDLDMDTTGSELRIAELEPAFYSKPVADLF